MPCVGFACPVVSGVEYLHPYYNTVATTASIVGEDWQYYAAEVSTGMASIPPLMCLAESVAYHLLDLAWMDDLDQWAITYGWH